MKWFIDQVQNFNLFNFFLTTLFTVLWTRTNTNKEIKTMSQQITADFQKLSSEVNQNSNMLAEQIGMAAKK
jgi:hypothetical protein